MQEDNSQKLSSQVDIENDARYLIMDFKYNSILDIERNLEEDFYV